MIIQLPPIDDGCRAFGERLKAVREARGLTLEDLARLSEIPVTHLALAEHGRERLDSSQLHRVIGALRIPLGLLFAAQVDLSRMRRF